MQSMDLLRDLLVQALKKSERESVLHMSVEVFCGIGGRLLDNGRPPSVQHEGTGWGRPRETGMRMEAGTVWAA